MKLYLLRHGAAADYADSDSLRPLSSMGADQVRRVVSRMARQMADVQAIYSSPKLRARQTADIASQQLSMERQVAETDLIKPGGDIVQLEQFIAQQDISDVLLVTHQPFVGNLIDYLTGQPGRGYEMGTGCLACLELIAFSRGCGTLQWLERP